MASPHALVTGAAGFIGSHVVDSLLAAGYRVTGLDNFDAFYDPAVKERNVEPHLAHPRYTLVRADVRDRRTVHSLAGSFDVVIHFAARPGVQPSLADPVGYQDVNVTGTQNLLEMARRQGIERFIFASSSSVYGVNPNVPWSEDDYVLRPISPYASTKISGELLGHVYSHLYGMRFIALRLFTVYGPRQRPDLAIHKFARRILAGEPIEVFGNGSTRRDYTYIDDIVQGIGRALTYDATRYEVINLGNDRTITLSEMIATLEQALGMKARRAYVPERPGDVPQTWARIDKARALLGYEPRTRFADGIATFADWLQRQQSPAAAS